MPKNRPFWRSLLGPFLSLGLAMGSVCSLPFVLPSAQAVEPDSPLFEKNQGTTPATGERPSREPMALPEEVPNPSPSLWSTLLRLILALCLIGGLIFLTVWGLKVLWEKRGWGLAGEENKPVRVLATTYLAPRRAVHLVEVGKRILVVGAGNNELTCLDVVTDPSEVEALRNSAQQGFPGMFQRVLRRQDAAQQEDEAKRIVAESKEVVGGYLEKLKGMPGRRKNPPRGPEEDA